MKIILSHKKELRDLILNGISSDELNENYDYSSITDMSYMFEERSPLIEVPLFDTSNVTTMSYMFNYCSSLVKVPLFDTSTAVNMNGTFNYCPSLVKIPLFETSSATDMIRMFNYCNSIIDIDPYNFKLFDFSILKNTILIEKYPELYV